MGRFRSYPTSRWNERPLHHCIWHGSGCLDALSNQGVQGDCTAVDRDPGSGSRIKCKTILSKKIRAISIPFWIWHSSHSGWGLLSGSPWEPRRLPVTDGIRTRDFRFRIRTWIVHCLHGGDRTRSHVDRWKSPARNLGLVRGSGRSTGPMKGDWDMTHNG